MNKIIPIPKKLFIGVLASAFVVGTTLPTFLSAEPAPTPHRIVLHPKHKQELISVKTLVAGILNFIPNSSLR